jgi:hypothetical protein
MRLSRGSPGMSRFPNVAPGTRAYRPLMRAAGRVATGRFCPLCGSFEIRRSDRRTFFDLVCACFLLAPFRCRVCRLRFYRVCRPAFRKPVEPPLASVIMMPRQILEIGPAEPQPIEPPRSQPERLLPRIVELAPIPAEPVRSTLPRSVLILESDLAIRKLLRRLLDRRGYFTHEVVEPEDLPGELRARRVDLLIIEASFLSDASLLSAALALASVHPNLKILALSSDSVNGSEIPGRCLQLTKPFSLDSFLACVDRLLEPVTPAGT